MKKVESNGKKGSRFDAVIFDMDGVIVDSEPRHMRAFQEVFAELGYGDRHGMDFPKYYGRSDRALWEDFVEMHRPPQSLAELTELKQTRLLEILRREKPLFSGISGIIERVGQNHRLAVASGSLHVVIDAVLEMESLRRNFPVVVSVEDVAAGKPAPDVFLRAAAKMGVEPARCCVIEDSAAGVTAGIAAGMSVVAITNTLRRDQLAHATRVVDSYTEFLEFVEGVG